MSDTSQGEGWWVATDGKWYAPELHPNYVAPVAPTPDPSATMIEQTPSGNVQDFSQGPPATAHQVAPQQHPPGQQPHPQQPHVQQQYQQPQAAQPQYAAAPPATSAQQVPHQQAQYQQPNGPELLNTTTAPGAPPATSETSVQRGKGARFALLGLLGLVFVGGLGFLAWRVTNSSPAGADSPEDAVQQLFDSFDESDPVGAVSIIDPEETDTWVGSFVPLFDGLEMVDMQEGEDPTEATIENYEDFIGSLSLEVTGPNGEQPNYTVEMLDDRLAWVSFDGLDIGFDGEANAGRAIVAGFGGESGALDLDAIGEARLELRAQSGGINATVFRPDGSVEDSEFLENTDLAFMAIERDGKWYLSIGYTILEHSRLQSDSFVQPDFGAGFRVIENQVGSESPEAVVTDFLTATETFDYRRMRDLTDPNGLPYFHDYWPLIQEEIDDAEVRDAANEIALRFDPPQVSVTEWEGQTVVNINQLSGVVDGGRFDIDFARGCATATINGDTEQGCLDEAVAEGLDEADVFSVDPRRLVPTMYGFVVEEQNGRWYIDPMATIAYHLDQVVDAVDDVSTEVSATSGLDDFEQGSLNGFFFVDAPKARVNESASSSPNEDGIAGVAIDLGESNLGMVEEVAVAVIRVTPNGQTELAASDSFEPTRFINGPTWGVATDRIAADDVVIPGIAAATTGDLQVDVFGITPSVLSGSISGSLDGEGTPQLFSVPEGETRFIDATGANFHVIDPWDSDLTYIFDPGFQADTFAGSGTMIVVYGNPGSSFQINLS